MLPHANTSSHKETGRENILLDYVASDFDRSSFEIILLGVGSSLNESFTHCLEVKLSMLAKLCFRLDLN